MKELIKMLKQLGADKDDVSNVEKQSLDCTISFNYDKPITWDYTETEKRRFEDEIKQIELIFIDIINKKGANLNPVMTVSLEFLKSIIEKHKYCAEFLNSEFVSIIFNRLQVLNYYLKTRNHNLIAVPDDKMKLKVTGPIEKKCKNLLAEEDETIYEYEFRGLVEIKIIDKED